MPDVAFWESHFQSGRPPWEIGEPAPPLVALAAALPLLPGKLLVPGCGSGADAVHFAVLGHEVTALDLAPSARSATAARAAAAGVELAVVAGDVTALPETWTAEFDAVLEHTCYCAIEPAQRDGYVREIARVLRPGGWLLALFFNHGRPGGPPYDVTEADVRRRFAEAFEIERLARATDSVTARAGQELCGLLRRR